MDSIDALDRAIMAGFLSSAGRKPGAVVSRLPKDVRDALHKLTSDEARSMRAEMAIKTQTSRAE